MPITQEQKERFKAQSFPTSVCCSANNDSEIYNGKEAILKKVNSFAFKWYASLSGKSVRELIQYGDQVNQDEAKLLKLGLTEKQVPISEFFIGAYNEGSPELFAIQPWSEGIPLRELPFTNILKNKVLRKNVGELFIKTAKRYQEDKQTVDLTGGKRIKILNKEIVDPLVFVWPFRTTNILVEGDLPVIVDSKTNNPNAHLVVRAGVIGQMQIARLIGNILTRI